MSNTVTLSKGGTAERVVEVVKIEIPSLWHIAQRLPSGERAEVLACWHLCHDLKRELLEKGGEMSEKKHTRFFVMPSTGDGLNTQPYPVALAEVGEHIKNWLGRFEHQGYYSRIGCRIALNEIGFRLDPVECGEDGQPWDWTHCAVCDKALDSHGDCIDAKCKVHTIEYTGEPQGSSVKVVSVEEMGAILRENEAANREHLEREALRDELEAATGQAYSDDALQAHIDAAGGRSTCRSANGRDLEAFEAGRAKFVDKLSEEEKREIAERESDNAKIEAAREYSAEDIEEWQRRSEEQGAE